jgi:hypothetical protein
VLGLLLHGLCIAILASVLPDGPASSRDRLGVELLPFSSAMRLPLSPTLAFSFPLLAALLVFCVRLLMSMFSGSLNISCPSVCAPGEQE